MAFLDRWYNPFVHAQAEDRCHRIGQSKDVNVVYFDCAATIHEAMAHMNKIKSANAAVLFADGDRYDGSLSYIELSGAFRRFTSGVQAHRKRLVAQSGTLLRLPARHSRLIVDYCLFSLLTAWVTVLQMSQSTLVNNQNTI